MKRLLATLSALGLSISALLSAETNQPVKEAAEKTAEATKKAAEKTTEATKKAAGKATEATKNAAEKTADTTKKAAAATKEKAVEVKEKVTGKPGELSESDKALVEHAKKSAGTLTAAQKKSLLEVVNTGDEKAVQELPGVGEKKAAAIIKARPIKEVEDLILVDGIGAVTFDGIVKHAGGSPEVKPAKEAKPAKEEPKKPAAKK